MANDEHKELAQFLKNVHSKLRDTYVEKGEEKAWAEHCNNQKVLNEYAKCMEKLATIHWEENCADEISLASSRIKWSTDFCYNYYSSNAHLKYTQKEIDIGKIMNLDIRYFDQHSEPYKLLDVGSCYNPFRSYDFLNVLALDLCPANEYVLECDFLKVLVGDDTIIDHNKVLQLKENSFDVVTFCFLLEYIPSSSLRIKACENAYRILKYGGLLLITTPDSKHVGANSKLMKCWRYTLATLGFSRICYEKLKHMHCMAFRKSLHKDVANRWAIIHKEPYMQCSIHIPQDFNNNSQKEINQSKNIKIDVGDFNELPFNDFN